MKLRSILFGYEVVGGRYVVKDDEADIVFSIYNMGISKN